MNDGVSMSITDRGTHFPEQLQSFDQGNLVSCTILVNRHPLDMLHHEVGQTAVGCPPVEQTRNVRMIEAGQDLSLITETAEHCVGIHAAFDQLDRNKLFVLLVGSLSQIDRAHSTPADLPKDAVGAK